MPEEKNIILTQKIRNPNPRAEDEWIDILEVDEDENVFIKAVVTTDNLEDDSVTYEQMYKGDNSDLKPVRSDTIQNGAIQNVAMYKISDEELGEDEDDIRPISADTIQKNAIVDSKIKNNEITLRKLGEPLAKSTHLNPFGDNEELYKKLYQNPENLTLRNYKIVFYSQNVQDSSIDKWET